MTYEGTDVTARDAMVGGGPGGGTAAGTATDTSSSVKDKAAQAKDQGAQAAGELTSTATERAQQVGDEVARQGRDLLDEARGHVSRQAGEQHQNLVANLHSLSDELRAMTERSEGQQNQGLATELVSQARERIDGVAQWLDGKEPGDLVGEARSFARRRPGAFLLGALAAGVVAGRLTRGVVAAHSDDQQSGTGTDGGYPAAESAVNGQHYASAPTTGTPTVPGYSSGTYVAPTAGPQAEGAGYQPTTTYGAPDPQNTAPSTLPGGFDGQFGGTQ